MTKVLIIEDDNIFGDMLSLYLTEEQYEVTRVPSAGEGLRALQEFAPNVVLLDLMLPDTEGINACAMLRGFTMVPIIVISAETKVSERILSLSEGADDYLCKPFSMQELKARIEAVLRRTNMQSANIAPPAAPSADEWTLVLDMARRLLICNGNEIETTFSEFEIIKLLYHNPGKVFSREELINAIRGIDSYINERAIDVHITNLRKKIEQNPKEPQYIKTVWGVGYKYIKK
ncbi:response regulator transcription factor [Paenibacillus sp. MMS18-CY102]|uniref:response regulator transcription factor n=1 Tax=Paenibacillus sp. MMS18-CY102 TaxID=2682849 RepID=UPI0013657D51|nr:response regulator transcription factor [Paenibacillus sp. MMS18-CY102]MWC28580.1 response regulator [Paenibacillus sp. MMS18-CY102]